jgi:putative flippase GtrA
MSNYLFEKIAHAQGKLSIFQFLLFSIMGAVGTIFHYLVLILSVEYFGLSPMVGTVSGSICGAIVNFVLSHQVVFRSELRFSETAPRFFSVVFVGLTLNAVLMYFLVQRLSVGYIFAQLMTTAVVLLLNYALNSFWTFNQTSNSSKF